MKNSKKIISGILALSLVSSCAAPVLAAEKEEVIYIMADADGTVNSVYAVNSFDGGDITDYGDYYDVKLMNIDGDISRNGDEISFSSPEGKKVYYQGTMSETEIPWNISIRYFMDKTEYSPEDIAGKSGALEIRINITENEKCSSDFYKNYALQCSFTLDTDICGSIYADGATIANVGSKKQITYTVLPDKGLEKSIYADVTDFEMAEGSINGIKMNLGIDIDDDEINEKINDLTDGAVELDDGAKELDDGAQELDDGAKELLDGAKELLDGTEALVDGVTELSDGTAELNDGAADLNDGIAKLRDGISEAQDGLSELCGRSSELINGSAEIKSALIQIQTSLSSVSAGTDELDKLVSASDQIKSGINELYNGIVKLDQNLNSGSYKLACKSQGLDIDALKAGNDQAIEQLTEQITELKKQLKLIENVPSYAEEAAKLRAQTEQLETMLTLFNGNNAAIAGTEAYLNTVSQSAAQLEAGAKELKSKYAEFDKSIDQMAASLSEMMVSLTELKNGINTLSAEYGKLDSGIGEYTAGVSKLSDGFAEIADGAKELADGGITLSDGVRELMDGVKELSDGTAELKDGTAELYDGASELKDGTAELKDGTAELKDGTAELRSETDKIDSTFSDDLDDLSDMLDSLSDDGAKAVSFVSEKNEEVSSVQFVIKTAAVEIPEAEETDAAPAEELNFWQKLLRLFGLY
ncbi:MAG: hypothetical protein ACI4J5_07885 [Oscillospiraceae bacterium]